MSKYIDKIIYINLDRREDRKEEIEKELNDFNLPYERFKAIDYPEHGKGIVGCTYSHLAVLKLAKERKYKNVLILEDDFTFVVSKEEFENQLTQFFEQNIQFDVCMISYSISKSESTEYSFVNRVIEGQTASGYIVNEHYYDAIIDLYEWAAPLLDETLHHWIYANDQVWKRLQEKDMWYYFKTRLGKQRPSYSDNSNQFFDYDC